MRRLSDTVARLSALRGQSATIPGAPAGKLQQLRGFGTNPGDLKAWVHLPQGRDEATALVVVLHGCTQDAASYDEGSGWSQLADELGFALLYPEQTRSNNFNLCFNWFEAADSRRGEGEPLSIVQMIEHMVEKHQLDGSQVFVTGLSAGGAMASVMLAAYPEIFAGGGIIAGLPFGCAASIPQALERMRGHGGPDVAALAGAVLSAAPRTDRRPKISIWHGTADHVVVPSNADASLAQWQAVHGLPGSPDSTERVAGHVRRVWRDAHGATAIEDYRIAGLGHGTPLATKGEEACGKAGPHMLDAGISSTRRIADFWGLKAKTPFEPAKPARAAASEIHDLPAAPVAPAAPRPGKSSARPAEPQSGGPARSPSPSGVGKIIEDALRAAGLMR
jgi:poly(hydroxyalkanoate) depolymerase family esterase